MCYFGCHQKSVTAAEAEPPLVRQKERMIERKHKSAQLDPDRSSTTPLDQSTPQSQSAAQFQSERTEDVFLVAMFP